MDVRRALVIGGGGGVAAPWEAGLVEGLRRAGVDLGAADVFVGTGWGSQVAACLASGVDLNAVIKDVTAASDRLGCPSADFARLTEVVTALSDTSIPGRERRRRVGRVARRATTRERAFRLDPITDCLPVRDWPDRPLVLMAVDADTGERVAWRRGGTATLPQAVRASASWPSEHPPTEIDGHAYIDGDTYSTTNADLAAGCDRVVVMMPLRHLVPADRLEREIDRLGDAEVTVIGPDPPTVELFSMALFESTAPRAAYEAGIRQAADQAAGVAAAWNG
ncbi:Patatin-like phospholipase [Actinomadura rubteroloni]|uniref:Patatin-like phospholipase n=1 Tax=Actinomadura rubteroloni TaxID=1926885 RepID=A0A2P4UDA8_9ACTN|nr:patatin-like phospholipase family protein [Actinomadura rubteroloni]POM23043.1 Patatin-like phospholipase [Actinomadura rubteroloni]